MKIKKIRGYKRIFKNIEDWKKDSLHLDLENLLHYQRNYEKVWVRPFSDISFSGSKIPQPKRKGRKLILEGLIEIFNSWETQLKTLGKPYYLAIWIYEPYIENSQVVCAIDGFLNFYDITFYRPEEQRKMPTQNYGRLKNELDTFNWIYALDENHFTNEDLELTEDDFMSQEDYKASKKWYKRKLKENPRSFTDKFDRTTYYTNRGTVWVGTRS
ncbi:hypothetical protein MC378_07385 [Polaribacter sp. MSW13]|uniref:Uncharacterized protein n=1 Tax=Polaribacter marinus TaxID=2916838 RepID=A0A9X1VQR7_9FLAO|nr:hypothetical protein [Polaribacter marinus]MCI2228985.1 hypothetical protein [Polaribacter marinus]